MNGEILIRQLNAPVPSWSVEGIRWVIEFWCDEMAYPVGQAWVMEINAGLSYYLDWIKVDEEFRRKGIGRRLIAAAKAKFDNVYSSGVTETGIPFTKRMAAEDILIDDEEDNEHHVQK